MAKTKYKSPTGRTFELPTGHTVGGKRAHPLPDGIDTHPDNAPFLSSLVRSGKIVTVDPAAKSKPEPEPAPYAEPEPAELAEDFDITATPIPDEPTPEEE